MNNKITLAQTVSRHEEHNLDYKILRLDNNYNILISSFGGRIYGPFTENSESIMWMHKAFADKDMFAASLKKHYFHVGGERLWIGPELKFFCKTPEQFDETFTVQKALDPGDFSLSEESYQGIKIEQSVDAEILSDNSTKSFYYSRTINIAHNPLTYINQLKDLNVSYCGFVQDIFLKDTNTEKKMYLEPWILTQINPGGRIIVPYFGKHEFDDYYEPVDDTVHTDAKSFAEWHATGYRKYKIAYKSANTFGRMGYVNKLEDGRYYLMIRNYYNDPSIPYCSEPWHNLGNRGTSMYFYNDDGSNGGFAEFENSCAMIGLDANKDESNSTTSLWFFIGETVELQRIIKVLLGIDYEITI